MKKIFLVTLIITMGVFILQAPSAVSAAGNVTIRGKVTNKGTPVKNTSVKITVDGNPIPSPTTDDKGNYSAPANVPPGAPITITVDENGDGAPDISTTFNAPPGDEIIANLHINPINIPEYDLLAGIVAVGAGFGLIAWQRRRQLMQTCS